MITVIRIVIFLSMFQLNLCKSVYELQQCEKHFSVKCGNVFIETFKALKGDWGIMEIYCQALKRWAVCASLGKISSCTGFYIDNSRRSLMFQMLFNIKTGLCRPQVNIYNHDKELAKEWNPDDVCGEAINKGCVLPFVKHLVPRIKDKKCIAASFKMLFDCYYLGNVFNCKSKLFLDNYRIFKKYRKFVVDSGALPYCSVNTSKNEL